MITIITTLLMTISIIASLVYIIYILSVESDRIKKTKKLKIIALSISALCFIIFLLKLFNGDTSNSLLWLFNTWVWLFNYYLNMRSLKFLQSTTAYTFTSNSQYQDYAQTPEKWQWLIEQKKNNNFNRMEKIEKKSNIWTKFVDWLKKIK